MIGTALSNQLVHLDSLDDVLNAGVGGADGEHHGGGAGDVLLLLGPLGRDGLLGDEGLGARDDVRLGHLGLVVALWDLLRLLEVTGDSRGQLGEGVVGLALS